MDTIFRQENKFLYNICKKGNLKMFYLLLDHGVDITEVMDVENSDKKDISMINRDEDMIRALISEGWKVYWNEDDLDNMLIYGFNIAVILLSSIKQSQIGNQFSTTILTCLSKVNELTLEETIYIFIWLRDHDWILPLTPDFQRDLLRKLFSINQIEILRIFLSKNVRGERWWYEGYNQIDFSLYAYNESYFYEFIRTAETKSDQRGIEALYELYPSSLLRLERSLAP
jgi:hypothetical protein